MNYLKIYVSLIEKAKIKNMKKQNGIAYEEHHIIPKCCYGSNNKSNLVTLTCREHFIAHRLLPYIYANTKFEYPLLCAIWRMSHTKKYKSMITSKSFQIIKNKRLTKPIPQSTRQKMRVGQLGRKHSHASNLKISLANKGTIMCNNGLRNFQLREPIPSNLCKGCIKKFPPNGMIWIHNNEESILININDNLPVGYQYGYVAKKYFLNQAPKYKFITNGFHNIKIKINDEIPNGYRLGKTKNIIKNKPTKEEIEQRISQNMIGRVWANNGKQNIFVYPKDVPVGFSLGKIKGKIWVNNGIKTILAYPNDIPAGFKKGIGRPPWQKIQNG